jgi:hypothetical protein
MYPVNDELESNHREENKNLVKKTGSLFPKRG